MAQLEPVPVEGEASKGRRVVEALDPATLEPLGRVTLASADDVAAAVGRARAARPATRSR